MFKEDTKFASKFEVDLLNKLTNGNFKYDDLILLEKMSGLDYRKRVYLNNTQIGVLEFDLVDLNWKFIPSACYYLIEEPKIKLKPTKRKLKGKYAEHLIENIDEFKKINNNYVGVELGKFVGVGIKKNERLKIKDLTFKKEIKRKKIQDFLKENNGRIRKMETKSIEFIGKYFEKYKNKSNYVINASFSGGKDSSISTLLAKKVIDDVDVLFIDTGLEYPETIDFVKKFAKEYDLNLRIIKARDFWKELEKEGIPTKDNRWCNSVCKLIPLKEFFEEEYKNKKIITIDGTRKYESFTRAKLKYERRNRFIPFQTSIFPILDWNALDVWSYIYINNILYNPLYDKGFERIGCYLCPSALNSEFLRVGDLYPELFNRWFNYLRKFYAEEDILRGFWRWKELPPKMKELKNILKEKSK
ncbi:phosphoadenosine phosphosulfate reductase domain-containing protein [Methanotorris formicicus]|uniref:Phosphoadenosine phosphosulfate reductase n=1 Tax=Methanotorris formicicus Mc-S-70 TaxID=647171 RepID=H1L1E7_9EURY|nr:phosphoadenosine phosphosulfate reductase family protein [Methanotorris formicicus]EHP83786.1 phosphoadenosine phosphosulfate reductase [Methanotorris formicicus Mc-S-70]